MTPDAVIKKFHDQFPKTGKLVQTKEPILTIFEPQIIDLIMDLKK